MLDSDGVLVEKVERDLEGDVEGRKFLRTKAADVVRQGVLGQADQAVAMDRTRMLQAFRLPDRHLGPQAVSAGGHGRAGYGAILFRVAEDVSADDEEHPRAFWVGAGRMGDAVQVSTPHGRA